MDRRDETRFPSDLQIRVMGLDEGPEAEGTVVDMSTAGICALLPDELEVGSLVKLELADTVLYGQIAYANEEDGSFRTGISVERVLVQASDLSHIMKALLDETQEMPRQLLLPEIAPLGRSHTVARRRPPIR